MKDEDSLLLSSRSQTPSLARTSSPPESSRPPANHSEILMILESRPHIPPTPQVTDTEVLSSGAKSTPLGDNEKGSRDHRGGDRSTDPIHSLPGENKTSFIFKTTSIKYLINIVWTGPIVYIMGRSSLKSYLYKEGHGHCETRGCSIIICSLSSL